MEEADKQRIDDERCLEDFLMDIDCLDKLDKWASRLNFFDILSVSGSEIRHSNFLAWILDPKGNHGLGDYVLRKFLLKSAKIYGPQNTPISIFDIDSIYLDDTVVERESSNIDIIAYSEVSKIVLVIENKIHSKEHSNQLSRYHKTISDRFQLDPQSGIGSHGNGGYRAFFIYLTLDGDNPSDDDWYPMSHQYLQDLVKSILENKGLSDRCRIYFEDYYNTLSGELMNDEELRNACMKIYGEHKQAIDLIMANIPNKQNEILQRCRQLLEGTDSVIILAINRVTLKFTTKRIRDKVGCVGYDNWVSSKDLLVFSICMDADKAEITLSIGPGDAKYRGHWQKYLSSTSLYQRKNGQFTKSWTMIQKKSWSQNGKPDEIYIEEVVKGVSDYLSKLPGIEDIIEKAPPYDFD